MVQGYFEEEMMMGRNGEEGEGEKRRMLNS
jgi:hypothetical protein